MSKFKRFLFGLVVTLCFYLITEVVDHFNVYMTPAPVEVEVTQLYSGASTGKYSHLEFIAVYRTNSGVYFDREVSAASYSRMSVGDHYTLTLRPMDIQQTTWDNVVWFILAKALLTSTLFAVGILSILVNPFLPKDMS